MEARCGVLIDDWLAREALVIEENRDAHELDVTAVEARSRGIVQGNETFIGRRVIAGNIQRELPTFIQYFSGSYRHVTCISVDGAVGLPALTAIESEFTHGFRVGNWLEQHIQTISSMALHGRGVFMLLARPNTPLNTVPVYVPPEDFIFPLGARDIQKCPQIAIGYTITIDQLDAWAKTYKWNEGEVAAIRGSTPDMNLVNQMFRIHMILTKSVTPATATSAEVTKVMVAWYSIDRRKLLSELIEFDAGFRDGTGANQPTDTYPVFPIYYNITENPNLIERKGRAFEDMHDQEALTMIWSAIVNGCLRASEVYVSLKDKGTVENPEITQTTFVMDPGKILKQAIDFNHAPWPDASMLQSANALKTENASQAGQVDFAAQARKDSRKTAKELSLAEEQTTANNTVPLTMFSSGYKGLIQFMWKVLQNNITTGFNKDFLKTRPDVLQQIPGANIQMSPAGDVDFVERQEKLKLYTQYFELFKGTAVGEFFLKKILELAFPLDYPQIVPLLADNKNDMGMALVHLLQNLPPGAVQPADQAKMQQIIAQATQTFGTPQNATQPNAAGAGQAGSQPGNPAPVQ